MSCISRTTVVPFTLAFGCSFSMAIPRLRLSVSLLKFRSCPDPPLEVVSGPYYWRTKPVWTYKPALRIGGVSIWRSVNYTGPSLNVIQRNVPQSNVIWPKKISLVTLSLTPYMRKKIPRIYVEKRPSSHPSYRLLLCPKMMKINYCDGQPSWPRLQWTFSSKISTYWCQSQVIKVWAWYDMYCKYGMSDVYKCERITSLSANTK